MIDKVSMNKVIDIRPEAFQQSQWRCRTITRNGRSKIVYTHNDNRVYYIYNLQSRRLAIIGRLVALSEIANRVSNLDELYEGATGVRVKQVYEYNDTGERSMTYSLESYSQNLGDIIGYVNGRLRDLLNVDIDIATFKVTYIEICFNVLTEHVGRYIELFNNVFRQRQLKLYKSFVVEMNKPTDTSFYVKGKVQFEKRYTTGYVVNFYNKLLQLNDSLRDSIEKYYKRRYADIPFQVYDFLKAKNVLRLEVQCNYKILSRLNMEYQFDSRDREFKEFINLDMCRDIIVGRYEYLIGDRC